jgi:glycosyltransferase involved in cell wall biosynthesis
MLSTFSKILFIIPCYNEEENIATLLQELTQINIGEGFQVFIAVINDCSKDSTKSVVEKFPFVTLLNLPINLGIGGAVQTGLLYALKHQFDFALQIDGDGQHPPSEIYKLLEAQKLHQANVVIGSRFIEKKGFQSSFLRRLGIKYLQIIHFILTGNSIKDVTSGFRLYDKKTLDVICSAYPDEYPEPDSLILLANHQLKVIETPVVMRKRVGGKSSIRYFDQIYYIVKVTMSMFFTKIRR